MSKRYEKVRTVGKGGFSTVYLVRDTHNDNEKCVLKEMIVTQMSAVRGSGHRSCLLQVRANATDCAA